MAKWLVVFIMFALVGTALAWWRRREVRLQTEAQRMRAARMKGHMNSWRCVAVRSDPMCCSAASAISGRRFLTAEAPHLPLPNCNSGGACSCSYQHFTDRRQYDRRGMWASNGGGNERRGNDRRKSPSTALAAHEQAEYALEA